MQPDFVFIGHGSTAAHAQIDGELVALLHYVKNLTCPAMFVGSGVELAVEESVCSVSRIVIQERDSEFAIGEIDDFKVLGYRNTDSGLPNIWVEGQRFFSMLHGPVLAKNPKLLARVANAIASAQPTIDNRDWFSKLNEVCRRIWELETDVPYEKLELR
jgi:hypothetical protein